MIHNYQQQLINMSDSTPQSAHNRPVRRKRRSPKSFRDTRDLDGFSSEEEPDIAAPPVASLPKYNHGSPQSSPHKSVHAFSPHRGLQVPSPDSTQSGVKSRNTDTEPMFLRSMSETTFTCGCCYELMIQPTTLNCGHSFCRLCLARWWKSVKKMTCPGCRQPWSGFPHINIILR